MKISVVVTTYNRPQALSLVLRGLLAQSQPPFEILIADDGSGDLTGQTIRQMARDTGVPIRHLWQNDVGFRAASARNMAVAAAQGELMVFLDGDCIPRHDFIAQHARLAQTGWFVAGSRLLLTKTLTEQVQTQQSPIHEWGRWAWWVQRVMGQTNRWLPLLNLPGQVWRRRQPQHWQSARTCNMAVWRTDLVAVNGFDESYQGWGHEDADLAVRLIRHGVHYKNGRFALTVLHLWHAENDRSHLPENLARLDRILQATHTQAPLGLAQHTPASIQQAMQMRA
jgi:glycosyltransferase involved in cell wall biosynthesis